MARVRRILTTKAVGTFSIAQVVQAVTTSVGVFTFIAGVLYLPTLRPTRVEMMLLLLGLAIFAMASTAVGQLAVILEKLFDKKAFPGEITPG